MEAETFLRMEKVTENEAHSLWLTIGPEAATYYTNDRCRTS